jgi:hypothetical protein
MLAVFIAVEVRENLITHHEVVDRGSESEKVGFHVGIITIDSQ